MISRICLSVVAVCLLNIGSASAQQELWLHVKDSQERNVRDVQLSERDSTRKSAPTSDTGLTKLDLPASTTPGTIIYLELHSPPNLKIALPLNARVVVPVSSNPEIVRVLQKRERIVLQSREMLTAIASLVIQRSLPDSVEVKIRQVNVTSILRKAALETVAGELELPADEMDQAIRNLSQSADDPFMKAIGKLYIGDYSGAYTDLGQFLLAPTDTPEKRWIKSDANFFFGAALLENGQFNDAAEHFKQAASAEPNNAHIFAAYGISLYKANRFAESLDTWDRLLQLQPTDKLLYLNKGFTLDKMGRGPDSIALFERYLKVEPDGPMAADVYNHLGDSYSKAGRIDKALLSYRASLKFSRMASNTELQQETFVDLRNLYIAKPDLKVAATYSEELLVNARVSQDKKLEVLLLGSLASTYTQQGDTQKALDAYAAAVSKSTESKAFSEVELVPLLKAYGALLQKNRRELEAQKIEARVQLMLGNVSAVSKH